MKITNELRTALRAFVTTHNDKVNPTRRADVRRQRIQEMLKRPENRMGHRKARRMELRALALNGQAADWYRSKGIDGDGRFNHIVDAAKFKAAGGPPEPITGGLLDVNRLLWQLVQDDPKAGAKRLRALGINWEGVTS